MQNFGQNPQRTSILQELSEANTELGEAVALIFNEMVVQSGITNPNDPFSFNNSVALSSTFAYIFPYFLVRSNPLLLSST